MFLVFKLIKNTVRMEDCKLSKNLYYKWAWYHKSAYTYMYTTFPYLNSDKTWFRIDQYQYISKQITLDKYILITLWCIPLYFYFVIYETNLSIFNIRKRVPFSRWKRRLNLAISLIYSLLSSARINFDPNYPEYIWCASI